MTTLGQRIREHRRRAGLSQEALARRMDVSRQAVTKWESGQSAPSTENLFRLAELFGTTVDLLLPSEEADAPAAEAPPPLWSRSRRRPRVLAALAVTAGYLVFYLLGRILWCPLEDSSLLGWLLWERPSGGESYLYGWLLSSGLFWWAMALSALTALLGRYRLSCTTCAYFLIGFLMGLVLGPHPPGAAMGHGHYGWAFWGLSAVPPHGAAGGTGGTEGRDVRFPPGTAAGGGTGPVPAPVRRSGGVGKSALKFVKRVRRECTPCILSGLLFTAGLHAIPATSPPPHPAPRRASRSPASAWTAATGSQTARR